MQGQPCYPQPVAEEAVRSRSTMGVGTVVIEPVSQKRSGRPFQWEGGVAEGAARYRSLKLGF